MRLDGRPLPLDKSAFHLDEANNFHISATFTPSGIGKLSVTSTLIAKMPRGHRQAASVRDAEGVILAEDLLSSAHPTIDSDRVTSGASTTFSGFFKLGVVHIITGYDHLLFLFALLIVVPNFRSAALIVTAFTVAHSITLGLATLQVVNVESKYVEPLIAATIVYVGIENLVRRDVPRGRWLLAFAFGLVHGFGFASVLRELGVSSATTGVAVPLVSFNLGVETGQLAITAVVLPIVFALRKRPQFSNRWVPIFSSVVIALGAFWFVERTLF